MEYTNCLKDHLTNDRLKPNISLRKVNEKDKELTLTEDDENE